VDHRLALRYAHGILIPPDLDVRKCRCELIVPSLQAKTLRCVCDTIGAENPARYFAQLAQMRTPHRRGIQPPSVAQHPANFPESPRTILDVVEHRHRHDRIKAAGLEGQQARLELAEIGRASFTPQTGARLTHHTVREIRYYDGRIGGQSIGVLPPQKSRAAPELEDRGDVREIELVEDPSIKAVAIGAEARVQRYPLAEVAGVLVLLFEGGPSRILNGRSWLSFRHR